MKPFATHRIPAFYWNPQRITAGATVTGVVVIGLSLLMPRFQSGSIPAIVVRDILMILLAGIVWPLHRMRSEGDPESFGLTAHRWPIALPINLALAVMLGFVFAKESPLPAGFSFMDHAGEIAYIMLAGVFECVVFYAYIRTAFARSFGAVAGVVAAAAFYSFHHAGFQPEFTKLFFVGLLYALPVALSGSVLTIFPFFWGIGAVWDVLAQSETVSLIEHPWTRVIILVVGMSAIAITAWKGKTPARVIEGGAIRDGEEFTAEEYGERMKAHLGAEYRRFAVNADKALRLPAGARVLEIGPGPGWAGIELCKLRKDITLIAVEASPDMIRAATKNAEREGVSERTEYRNGVVEDLSAIGPGTFDAVISRDSLHHWTDPARAFSEIKHALKDSGGLYITDEKRNLGFAERIIVRAVCARIGKDMAKGWTDSIGAGWTPAEVRAMLAERDIREWTVRSTFLALSISRPVDRAKQRRVTVSTRQE